MASFTGYIEGLIRELWRRTDTTNQLLSEILQSSKSIERKLEISNTLISSGINASPYLTETLTVSDTPIQLYRNSTTIVQRIMLMNYDFAQQLFFGPNTGVTVNNGIILNPQNNYDMALLPGDSLYGIVAIPSITVAVMRLTDVKEKIEKNMP